ncbi:hypothetical protein [Thalassomonas haliotis]|uniref:Lipoprotein n=1 Tax=Thalassomonas haliotis TaxID=485448 RepID=A0ABY7VF48_9GAMM|nr:hypothetical protein [Thalassomonas haliotis]WDE12318.1 hypothetical protein H3N35_02195 [Thalassomonas haliotis]
MKKSVFVVPSLLLILSGCATQEKACEDITLVSEQIQQCQALQRQIAKAKGKPILRTELERRYQQDCVDIRYYRDEHQIAICGNKEKIKKASKEPEVQEELK